MRRIVSVLMGLGILSILFFMGFSGARVQPDNGALGSARVATSYHPAGPIIGSRAGIREWAPVLIDPAISETATSTPAEAGCRPLSPLSPACSEAPGRSVGVLVGTERWRPLIERYFRSEDVDRALAVIACESGGDPAAANPTSSARGLFQHLESYWEKRTVQAGLPGADIFDPEDNVAVAAWLVYEAGGWSHWNASRSCW